MPIFSELEKEIIRTIADAEIGNVVGWSLRRILFPKDEAAFACIGIVDGQYIYSLMSANNGGSTHNKVIERLATFISLMQWMDFNRMIMLNPHSHRSGSMFYEGCDSMHYSPKVDESGTTHGSIRYYAAIGTDAVFRYRASISSGYVSGISCIGIADKTGLSLGPCLTSTVILDKAADYLFSAAYPTIALKELIADEFMTHDEKVAESAMKSAEQQVVKAQWTLVIAIVTLIFTVVYALFSEQRPQASFIVLAFLMLAVGCLGAIIGKRS